ncbi:MAG: PD-(D/E)XK nuclease family protein [Candidatus Omnitrophica bacterium]|nr:PD-(D/E)XK nuclease family protein [Candidatus Omnitrophota bacterium]MCM8800053.1 PD-(D/E)XK nuclease family protein [Candidatus Omnitrophota bacterium]
MIKLSPSSLNLFLECPRCFWIYVNKGLERPRIPVATITTGLDRVIKDYFNSYRSKNTLPPILEGKLKAKLISHLPNQGRLEYVDLKENAKLIGYLDECLDLGDNFYAALDHKTRGLAPEEVHQSYQLQMDVYTLLLEENGFSTKRIAYIIYYIPKLINERNEFQFDIIVKEIKTDPFSAKKLFYEALKVLRSSIPKINKDCEFCEWSNTKDIR